MVAKKAAKSGEMRARHRMVPVSRKGAPEVLGAEFVVGPLDPPVTLAELVRAAADPALKDFYPEELQITGNTSEDGYMLILLIPRVSVRKRKWTELVTPAIPKSTLRAAIG